MTKLCITVCTRERPKMLGDCLASVLPQMKIADFMTRMVVVENDVFPRSKDIVSCLARDFSGCDLQYCHEIEIGISSARNRAVEEALSWGADWIIFIDDDEVAAPDWLAQLSLAMKELPADVLHGHVELVYPDDFPLWQRLKPFRGGVRGNLLETAATNNTAARSWIFANDRAGLRFDKRLSFSGGEDIDLFHRARKIGATLRWVPEACVFEHVTGGRSSEAWHLKRARRLAANEARHRFRRDGTLTASLTVLFVMLRLGCEAVVAVALATTFRGIPQRHSTYMFKSKLKSSKIAGYLIGLSGRSPPGYNEVEGH